MSMEEEEEEGISIEPSWRSIQYLFDERRKKEISRDNTSENGRYGMKTEGMKEGRREGGEEGEGNDSNERSLL